MQSQSVVVSGDVAFAYGAVAAGVQVATGYPGSPSSGTVDALLRLPEAHHIQVTWAINECVALEMAFGAALAGSRALLCVKSVGMNVALDPLMSAVLTGSNAGLVILLGDDPGGWASQNEQDTRIVSVLADIPLVEPADLQEAQDTLIAAFDLSEEYHVPVIVRETRALALAKGPVQRRSGEGPKPRSFVRERMRWISLPENVVENHRRLHDKLDRIQQVFEKSPLNRVEGEGHLGIVACGATYPKLQQALGTEVLSKFRVLKLGTFHPLPEGTVGHFLSEVDSALVFEENEAYIEQKLSALAHKTGLETAILGRGSGYLPQGGELDATQILSAVRKLAPAAVEHLAQPEVQARDMPSQQRLCDDCPYVPLFEVLLECIEDLGGRDRAIIVGEPGCMVRAYLPPFELFDVKYSLGASVGLGVGVALAKPVQRVIALTGDSSFLHHGWGGLVEGVRSKVDLLVIVLDNGTTALSGRQPHAGTAHDARHREVPSVDMAEMTYLLGIDQPRVIDPFDKTATHRAIKTALAHHGLEVIIARSPCPRMT